LHADLDPNSGDNQDTPLSPAAGTDRKRASPDHLVLPPAPARENTQPPLKQLKTSSNGDNQLISNKSGKKEVPTTALLDHVSRRRRWASLLKERPTGLGQIHPWLGKVLSVSAGYSESAGETSKNEEISTNPANAIQESRWNILLDECPPSSAGDAVSTKWLIQVLETSCTQQQKPEDHEGGVKNNDKHDDDMAEPKEGNETAKNDNSAKDGNAEPKEDKKEDDKPVTADKKETIEAVLPANTATADNSKNEPVKDSMKNDEYDEGSLESNEAS
jgi:hypothetical protein